MFEKDAIIGAFVLALIGAGVGVGQLLASKEVMNTRLVIGRAISSGALGMAAAAVISFMPSISFAAQMGLAAALASLGTSALERVVQRIVGGA